MVCVLLCWSLFGFILIEVIEILLIGYGNLVRLFHISDVLGNEAVDV